MGLDIIDAHLHFARERYFDEIARAAGHENTGSHLMAEYGRLGILHGVVMGNSTTSPEDFPEKLSYCVGLEAEKFDGPAWKERLASIEAHLQRRECVGIKLYPGYAHFYIYDEGLSSLYALAEKYHKPVAVHTGLTAMSTALLKYSHPLVMDEAAARFQGVQFVMCHFGEPWFTDAVAVLEKNPNVAADLSGILEGKIHDWEKFSQKMRWYMEQLRGWMEALDHYDRFMFGTDWPLANLEDYIKFTKRIVPEAHWGSVFCENARRIYGLEV